MRRIGITVASLMMAAGLGAHAQQAKFCNNALVANSFYSNVLSNGKTANVEYHGQFQNQDPQRRALTATMLRPAKIGNYTVMQPVTTITLSAYQQKDIKLLFVQTTTPSGQGAPTPQQVSAQIRFTCTFH